jgi:thiol-disulfide isomerase/thioredoxin
MRNATTRFRFQVLCLTAILLTTCLPTRWVHAAPFPVRTPPPAVPADAAWLNTAGPLQLRDLRGKFVLLDFWTYCCINCHHVLPVLKQLEKAYPNELVVIGVHSAKFETEKSTKNIEQAILRHGIEHPVINDSELRMWRAFEISAWPSVVLIDPEGYMVAKSSGEFTFEAVDSTLKKALPYYRKKGTLDLTPIRFELLANRSENTPLKFPGKVLADSASNRLFLSDTGHNRIVAATLDGKALFVIGDGQVGWRDGDYGSARFNKPQGMALADDALYVADTENHRIRKIDLARQRVSTVAGTGEQSRNPWIGVKPGQSVPRFPSRYVGGARTTPIASPWALRVHGKYLYIAMAGPHQIWRLDLSLKQIGPYAGNGREDIVDGPLLPRRPYDEGFASFAQPSGVASDGDWLYVADSEGSSIRAVPLDPKQKVRTVVGTARLPSARLFTFGDRDGKAANVLLQHPLGIDQKDGALYVADTYNNKIKRIDASTGETTTIAGDAKPGRNDGRPGRFDEPAGVSIAGNTLFVADTNNHLIRAVDRRSGDVKTLSIDGLEPPEPAKTLKAPSFPFAKQERVPPVTASAKDGVVRFRVKLDLPRGYKLNALVPPRYVVEAIGASGPVDRSKTGVLVELKSDTAEFEIAVPLKGEGQDRLKISIAYYYCQEGNEGLCKVGAVTWNVDLIVAARHAAETVQLSHTILP